MITAPIFAGKRYAVLGLARSGMATLATLLDSGAEVVAWDMQEGARNAADARAIIADLLTYDLTGFDGVIVSPGVPLNRHPIAPYAAGFGVPIIGDIELFAQARSFLAPHRVVGITGTNGKSTTTALITHILQSAGVEARMGGNIGLPILGEEALPEGGVYVLELSSYQIDLTQSLDCDVTVMLSITPDHLDRYADFDAYAASKGRLFTMQSADRPKIVAATSDPARKQVPRDASQVIFADVTEHDADQSNWPALQGPHNLENALCARAACRMLGLCDADINAGLASYRSLPHRMEVLGAINDVTFVNDSKATNAASSAPALAAYPPIGDAARIHWIVGGVAKEDGLGECEAFLPNVKAAYTIGESARGFERHLKGHDKGVHACEVLSAAVVRAFAAAQPGDVILLSPACASFDQYPNFEVRGDEFRAIFAQLRTQRAPVQ